MNKLIITLITLLFSFSALSHEDCVSSCIMKRSAYRASVDPKVSYLKKYCNQNDSIEYNEMLRDLKSANIRAYGILNSKEFFKSYCNNPRDEGISFCRSF